MLEIGTRFRLAEVGLEWAQTSATSTNLQYSLQQWRETSYPLHQDVPCSIFLPGPLHMLALYDRQ